MTEQSTASLADLTATAGAAGIRSGAFTSEELVESCLGRVRSRDDVVQAWAHLDRDYARSQSRERDRWRATGAGVGPLHGVPVGIKDIIDTADMPTENGTSIHKGRQPREDAAAVAALRSAGAIIMGKTVTAELANVGPGRTRNPHNPEHTPGGSSSGSAAAVACGMVPLALGTQTGGSVIRPSSFCGIYALKPTLGLISRVGVTMQSHTLDTVGIHARSIDDLALVADCLGAYDPRDNASWPRSSASLREILQQPPPVAPTFAFCPTPAWPEAEQVTKDAFAELVGELGERCDTIELPPPFDHILELHRTVMWAENAHYYGGLLARAGGHLSDALRSNLEAGGRTLAKDYLAALNAREVLHAGLERIFERYDALVVPAAPGPAPKGLGSTGNSVFNSMWTFLGSPALTLPLLEAEGLPLGVQLIGRCRDDGRLLRTARWLVEHLQDRA